MLHYMRSLLPGFPDSSLFEAIFIDLLPANARDAAVKHDLLEDMAEAADKVLAEAPSAATVSVVSTQDEDLELAQLGRAPAANIKKKDPPFATSMQGTVGVLTDATPHVLAG